MCDLRYYLSHYNDTVKSQVLYYTNIKLKDVYYATVI